jgi:hypothetical protein
MAELIQRPWLSRPPFSAAKSAEEPDRIPGRAKQVRCFENAGQLRGRNQRNVSRRFPANNDDLLIVGNTIQDRGEMLPKLCVRGFDGHKAHCTGNLYVPPS